MQDFLSVFECKRLAMTGNIKSILLEIGQKYMRKLHEIYEKITPTTKRVTAFLQTDASSQAHLEVFGYLKRYVKGMDEATLTKFLRYCTGALSFSL